VTASSASSGEVVWYVLGVIGKLPGEPTDGLGDLPALLPDRPLEAVARGDLRAVACRVPADLLDERATEDLDLVERLARGHDRVLRALARRTVVVPARLGSLYPSRQAVARMLDDNRTALTAALERLSGRFEWGVKVYAEPAQERPAPRPPAGDRPSGVAYLRRKQAEQEQRAAAQRDGAALAAELHRAIAARAHAAVSRPQQDPRLSGRRTPMLLNGAYLVDRADEKAFTAAVHQLAERHQPAGLRLELTGPWPPYSFAGLGA
jgi:Gas vesicle synthesis protein GvpL/GvpF